TIVTLLRTHGDGVWRVVTTRRATDDVLRLRWTDGQRWNVDAAALSRELAARWGEAAESRAASRGEALLFHAQTGWVARLGGPSGCLEVPCQLAGVRADRLGQMAWLARIGSLLADHTRAKWLLAPHARKAVGLEPLRRIAESAVPAPHDLLLTWAGM